MAIGTGDAVEKFGTLQTLEATGAAITAGLFGVANDLVLTATDDVIYGALGFNGVFAAAPSAGGTIDVYLQTVFASTAGNANTPSDDFPHLFVGSLPTDASAASPQRASIDIGLENVSSGQTYNVYIKNSAGANLNSGWLLEFTPKAIGPAA